MQYSFTIDQRAYTENFPTLDVKDAAIVDFITKFSKSKRIKLKVVNGAIYYWIDYGKVADEMPMLGLKAESVRKRIRGICATGILEPHPSNQGSSASYFAFGKNFEKTAFSDQDEGQKPADELRDENPEVCDELRDENPNLPKVESGTPELRDENPEVDPNFGTDFPIHHNTIYQLNHIQQLLQTREVEEEENSNTPKAEPKPKEIPPPAPAAYPTPPSAPIPQRYGFNFEAEIEAMKSDYRVSEYFSMNCRIPGDMFAGYLEDFKRKELVVESKHNNRADLRNHFFNYSRKRYQDERQQRAADPTKPVYTSPAPIKPPKSLYP